MRKSWRITGLFPLDINVALQREGAQASGLWSNIAPDTTPQTFLGMVLPGQPQKHHRVQDGRAVLPDVQVTTDASSNLVGTGGVSTRSGAATLIPHRSGLVSCCRTSCHDRHNCLQGGAASASRHEEAEEKQDQHHSRRPGSDYALCRATRYNGRGMRQCSPLKQSGEGAGAGGEAGRS